MVVFTCNACGESLKKAQVEKHVMKCRSCQVLSCIDCSKDFWGDDYRNHIKCISEDQKYGSKDFQVKVNKGDVKQQQWIQVSGPSLRSVLQKVSAYDNVPRKRAKFENWMKNCLKICSPCLLEKVWEICSTAAHSVRTASERENRSDTNDGAETNKNKRDERKDKKSKRKTSDENTEQNGENTEKQRRRKRRREENEQNTDEKSNKQQKRREQEAYDGEHLFFQTSADSVFLQVLAAYHSFTGDSNYRSEEELLSLFNRKINNNPKFKILKDRVRLLK
uniref:Cell growth-regulating nucleolar protein n=1 Tax=Cyprinus carpio TaxID=7962 RepID=A0A8C2GDI0_CYPCA